MQLLKTLYLCENPIERYLVTVHICYLVFGPLCLFQCFHFMPEVLEVCFKEKLCFFTAKEKVLMFVLFRKVMLVQKMLHFGKVSGEMMFGSLLVLIGQQGS